MNIRITAFLTLALGHVAHGDLVRLREAQSDGRSSSLPRVKLPDEDSSFKSLLEDEVNWVRYLQVGSLGSLPPASGSGDGARCGKFRVHASSVTVS